jgi:hypothetical protein
LLSRQPCWRGLPALGALRYLWKQVLAERLAGQHHRELRAGGRWKRKSTRMAKVMARRRKKRKQVFPRFHQLRTVRALLRRAREDGVGKRYLIQHSAGSGKSNTIAWLAHQLVELRTATAADPLTGAVRFHHRHHRPPRAGYADRPHHQGLRPCGVDLRPLRQRRRSCATFLRQGQEDHRHHGAEISVHPRRAGRPRPGQEVRTADRRGAFQSGRQDHGQDARWRCPARPDEETFEEDVHPRTR